MKIGFITDTNIIRKNTNELYEKIKYLDNIDFFTEYMEALDRTPNATELIYYMPNIIIEELYYQKLDIYNKRYQVFEEKYNNIKYGLIGECPENNIEEVLNNEKNEYIKNNKIIMLNLKYSKELFEEITNDALKKKPPFDKTDQGYKTDAGFKDALIWKTVLGSKEIDECDKLYFCSADDVFEKNKEKLKKEFESYHSKTELIFLFFKPDGNQRQNYLKTIIKENNLVETEIIRLYDMNLILKIIHDMAIDYNQKEIIYREEQNSKLEKVLFNEFSNEDFRIENIVLQEGKYEADIVFNTKKYIITQEQAIDLFNKKLLTGRVKIKFSKETLEFEKYEVLDLQFIDILEESLNQISNILKDNINRYTINIPKTNLSESLKPLLEKVSEFNIQYEYLRKYIENTPPWMEQIKKLGEELSECRRIENNNLLTNNKKEQKDYKKENTQKSNNKKKKDNNK